jgi:hypothetical protein
MVIPTMEAISLWQGVAVPNEAARHGLAEMAALIAAVAARLSADRLLRDLG